MGVPSSSPPPPGTVGVGELLGDAQTRTLWFGVPASIDPQQSLLVSDIVGLQQEDADTLASAQAYADAGLAGKANTVHTHVISDVTGLQAALDDATNALPLGCIVIWHGILGDIPGGWALCDGSNGTPDLRDRFILGAGGTTGNALDVGGSKNRSITSALGGAHTPAGTVGDHVLTGAEIPAHGHGITDPGHTHAINDPQHTHPITMRTTDAGETGGISAGTSPLAGAHMNTTAAGTGISIIARVTGITVNNAGGGGAHNHPLTLNAVPGHSHTVAFDVMPPYIILGYIMRV